MEKEGKKTNGKKSYALRNFTIVAVVALLFYLFLLKPYITFKNNEKVLRDAGIRYFRLNDDKLPTGKRVSTVTLQELATSKYVESDFYEPFSKKLCSITDSWVKVRREGSEYKYYAYLDCGVVSSTGVDHNGPVIKLKDKENLIVDRYSDFNDPGVESVIDDNDGKIDINDVTVNGKVDTDATGEYELVYTVSDSLANTTKVIRKITVVERIKDTVMKATNSSGYFRGNTNENYIYFGANLYRIIGIDNDNVRLISNTNVGNVNYSALDKYLEKYYKSLPEESRKLIVKSRYCNDKGNNIYATECSSYTALKKYSVPSLVDVNKANAKDGNFMLNGTIVWSNNTIDNKNSYGVRNFFANSKDIAYSFSNEENYGVRPVITIDGRTLIKGGNGKIDNPYTLKGDVTYAKANTKVNERYAGEYLTIDNHLWRISKVEEDGTTKVIYDGIVFSNDKPIMIKDLEPIVTYTYNPKKKGNVGYFVNNKLSEYISTDYFVKHTIEVPIYKNKPEYGKTTGVKKYDVKLSIPGVYDLYNVYNETDISPKPYFLIDSYTEEFAMSFMSYLQSIITTSAAADAEFETGIRPVAYLTDKAYITYGNGTSSSPYKITKK